MVDATRIPVLVGVGQVNDRPEDPSSGLDSLGLMEAALRVADADAAGGWLREIDALAVVAQISFPSLRGIAASLAGRLGIAPALCHETRYPSGDSPTRLLNEAANRIGAGESVVAAVAGGEALQTATRRAARQRDREGAAVDAVRAASMRARPSYAHAYGLTAPVDVYPLYENALRAALGQTLAEAQTESGEIWSRLSEVAARSPGAWIRRVHTVEEIVTPGPSNRRLAFPYTKLMVANSSVNQGAAFLVTSLARARARGVPEHRLVYVGLGAAAGEPVDVVARDRYDQSVSLRVTLERALERNALAGHDLDRVELYSCFPCIPKLARRVIDWPLERPVSVFGGLTFGGGPVGNYMSHALVSMVEALRDGGRHGLLFANGGFATYSHSIVLSRDPERASRFPQSIDLQSEVDACRGPLPEVAPGHVGRGTVETYTVFHARDGTPRAGVVVARSSDGRRFLAHVPPTCPEVLAWLMDPTGEPVGSPGRSVAGPDDLVTWQPA